jgi:hypothetical protein
MNSKKLALASAMALMFAGAAHAVDISSVTVTQDDIGALTALVTAGLPSGASVNALSGAINTAVVNGAIDISGVNVTLGALQSNVSATANATATTSNADAFAIAGAKLSTTVIGAMNSATVDVMAKHTDQTDKTASALGMGTLASQGGTVGMGSQTFGTGQLGLTTTGSDVLSTTGDLQLSLTGLTSSTSTEALNKVSELQSMNVFNTAINTATLDAGIRVVAAVDPNAWFLNPQTGVVNLSNISMATTAIGAMNSSLTRLGANLAK